MTNTIPTRRESWFSNAINSLGRALRPLPADAAATPAPKLEPIADVLSRAGREHADSK